MSHSVEFYVHEQNIKKECFEQADAKLRAEGGVCESVCLKMKAPQ